MQLRKLRWPQSDSLPMPLSVVELSDGLSTDIDIEWPKSPNSRDPVQDAGTTSSLTRPLKLPNPPTNLRQPRLPVRLVHRHLMRRRQHRLQTTHPLENPRVAHHDIRPIRDGPSLGESRQNIGNAVAVHAPRRTAKRIELLGHGIDGQNVLGPGRGLQIVVVDDQSQIGHPVMRGEHGGLPDISLLQRAIRQQTVNSIVIAVHGLAPGDASRLGRPLPQRAHDDLEAQLPLDRALVDPGAVRIVAAQLFDGVGAVPGQDPVGHYGVMSVRRHKPVMEPALAVVAHLVQIQTGRNIRQGDTLARIAAALNANIKHIAPDFRGHPFKRQNTAVRKHRHQPAYSIRVASTSASRPSRSRIQVSVPPGAQLFGMPRGRHRHHRQYWRTAPGYYIDVGGSRLVKDGNIGVRSGVGVDRLEKHAVVLSDGSTLEADAVVYATGFGSMEEWVARLIDRPTADRVGRCWGYGSGHRGDPGPWEGEIRTCGSRPRSPACGSWEAIWPRCVCIRIICIRII